MNLKIKQYFQFSRNEKRGILVLLLLIIFGLLFPKIHKVLKKEELYDYSGFEKQIETLIIQKQERQNESVQKEIELFNFDPNKLDKDGFEKLGFSGKVINTIINYRNKGGVFYIPEDLNKIYGLSTKDYTRIKPYIVIDKAPNPLKIKKTPEVQIEIDSSNKLAQSNNTMPVKIEINGADSLELITIKGIGPVFANRIIKYRNYLGGFCKIEQLKEIYGITEELYVSIETKFEVDANLISTININNDSFKQVNKHPYISYKQTKAIFKYKDIMTEIQSLNELVENNLLDTLTFQKVSPYLKLKN